LDTGTWLAECSFTEHSGNHRGTLDLRQWLPATAGRQRLPVVAAGRSCGVV